MDVQQYSSLSSPVGLKILAKYSLFFTEWREELLPLLSDDWEGGAIKCPLLDMPILAKFLVLMNYIPSSTNNKTSYDCSTTRVIAEFFGHNFIYIDLIPVAPTENLKKDGQMWKYSKNSRIVENYCGRFECLLELQRLVCVRSTVLIGGKPAATALSHLPHDSVLESLAWSFTRFPSCFAIISNHLSSGMMSETFASNVCIYIIHKLLQRKET